MPSIDTSYLSRAHLALPQAQPLSLRTGSLSASSAGTLRAPQIQAPHLVPSQETPVQNRDVIGPVIAHVGEQIGKAAITYADKVATTEAAEAAANFTNVSRGLWLGYEKKDGSFQAGYAATTSKAAVDGYHPFQAAVLDARNQIAGDLSDLARSKFLARSNASYQGLMNQAAQHAAGGTKQYEDDTIKLQQQTFYQSLDDLLLVESPTDINNMLQDHLTNMSTTYSVPASALQAMSQKMYKDMGTFIAAGENPDVSLAKVQKLSATFGSNFDIDTATHYRGLTSSLLEKSELLERRTERKSEQQAEILRQENRNRYMVQSLEDPLSIDLDRALALTAVGAMDTTVYLALESRFNAAAAPEPVTPEDSFYLKTQLQYGYIDENEFLVDIMDYDKASRNDLMTFARTIKNADFKRKLTLGYEMIDDTVLAFGDMMTKTATPRDKRKIREHKLEFYDWLQKNFENPQLDIPGKINLMLGQYDQRTLTTDEIKQRALGN